MQADGHRHHAESLERTVTLAQQDPSTSVGIIEATWAAAYHWLCYGCIKRHQQHRDKHQGLAAYFDSLGERTAANGGANLRTYDWQDFTAIKLEARKFKKHLIYLLSFMLGRRHRKGGLYEARTCSRMAGQRNSRTC